jgi:tetratricopeptide (TPR) repeat protein
MQHWLVRSLARPFAIATLAVTLLGAPLFTLAAPAAQAQDISDAYQSALGNLQSGDYEAAIADFNEVLAAGSDVAQAYVGRATAQAYAGNLAAALQDLTQAAQANPALAEAFYNRGILRAQMGDASGAVGDLQHAAALFESRGDATTAALARDAATAFQQ